MATYRSDYRSDGPAEQIKRALTAEQVARQYGFEPKRGGFLNCPFHSGDKNASLKLYPDAGGWHCFGCGKGGSVIDFVMDLFDISFQQAILRLNLDFRLGLTGRRPTRAEVSAAMQERAREQEELSLYRAEYEAKNSRFKALWEAKRTGPDALLYADACKELDYLDCWFQEHPWR